MKADVFAKLLLMLEAAEQKLNNCGSIIPIAEWEQKISVKKLDQVENFFAMDTKDEC